MTGWYYKGSIGGGFNYWPEGPHGQPQQIIPPVWGRAVVAENEMMYHQAQASGPAAVRKPAGLDISSTIGVDPSSPEDWRIETFGQVTQHIPAEEMRLLLHWGARVSMNFHELKTTLDHTDDIAHEQALDILISDLRRRKVAFDMPADPMTDRAFIGMLSQVYQVDIPQNAPPGSGMTSLRPFLSINAKQEVMPCPLQLKKRSHGVSPS